MKIFFRDRVQFLVAISILLFSSCAPGTEEAGVPVPTHPPAIPTDTTGLSHQDPLPQHAAPMAPRPGDSWNLLDYRQGLHTRQLHPLLAGWVGPSVCVQISPSPFNFLEPGDRIESGDQILERTQFIIDGKSTHRLDEIMDFEVESSFLDEDGSVVAKSGGPYIFCWRGDLDVGFHTAQVEVRKTSGRVWELDWSFTLLDPDNFPTSTPFVPNLVSTTGVYTVVPMPTYEKTPALTTPTP